MPTEGQKAEIVGRYMSEAKSDNARYNPLQCAAYSCDRTAVEVLIEYYTKNNTLAQELQYMEGKFGESILHIAMKDSVIFEACCQALKRVGLFEAVLMRADGDQDTVLHQVVAYGRKDALNTLMSDEEVRPLLAEALQMPNKHHETAWELCENFERSQTITTLKQQGAFTDAQVVESRRNLPSIHAVFDEIVSVRPSLRM